ncbi:MAG: hypothetical protein IT289_11630 [Oligoflexia bacterium]|nr:hypothetical protein [Oligoflexia bacterium]
MKQAWLLIFISLALASTAQSKQFVMKLVGIVGGQAISSRDVEVSQMIDRALFASGPIQSPGLGSADFTTSLNKLIIECMVDLEARDFGVARVTDSEILQSVQIVKSRLLTGAAKAKWNSFGVGETQLKELVGRKLRANRFIKYKTNSSFVQVTDDDAERYFEKNRIKFGSLEFEKFKASIKKYLANKNAEDRLRDWFEILKKKHKVRNLTGASDVVSPSGTTRDNL